MHIHTPWADSSFNNQHPLCRHCSPSTDRFLTYCLPISHRLFINCSPIVHRFLTDCSPISHRSFTDCSPSVHRLFTDIYIAKIKRAVLQPFQCASLVLREIASLLTWQGSQKLYVVYISLMGGDDGGDGTALRCNNAILSPKQSSLFAVEFIPCKHRPWQLVVVMMMTIIWWWWWWYWWWWSCCCWWWW